MGDFLSKLRFRYGRQASFVTVFQDGTEVPWNPLSIGQYAKHLREQDENTEDNIFDSCVTDDYLKSRASVMKAGVVSTVVAGILAASAPSSIDDYQFSLNYFRHVVRDNLIDQMTILICQAFPSYTPTQVQGMIFEEFMYTLALAEKKLLDMGILTEPLALLPPEDTKSADVLPEKKDVRNLREEWLKQQKGIAPPSPPPSQLPVQAPPIPEWHGEQTIITARDMQEHAAAIGLSDGHQACEMDILVHDMLKETAGVYSDYVHMMQKGDKITPDKIKTLDERRELALERAKQSEMEYQQKAKMAHTEQVTKDSKLETLFRKHLPVRKHKRR